ncbi:MAG: class I SAM-dependent methyltransferase [Candidatus Buchananbacteria bacterium]
MEATKSKVNVDFNYYRKEIDSELKLTEKMVDEAIIKHGRLPDAVFDLRAVLYGLAMEVAGKARAGDLVAMYELIKPKEGESSVEIASGTGFLTVKLIEWTNNTVFAVDPSEKQLQILKGICPQAITIVSNPEDQEIFDYIPVGQIDIVTSFGGIHHNLHQRKTFENVAKMLRPGGRFCAADVADDTILAEHFDKVVSKKCLTGHNRGAWLSEKRLHELCDGLPLEIIKAEIKPLTWDFESEAEMVLFFKGLHAYDLPDQEIVKDLRNTLGCKYENGVYKLNWPMLFFEIIRKR